MGKLIVMSVRCSTSSTTPLTCQMAKPNIIWPLFSGTNQQKFDIDLVSMMTKKQKHVMSNYGKLVFILKARIVSFQCITFFVNSYLLNIKFLPTEIQLNIWQ